MKTTDTKKKVWLRPEVHVLNIKKDTFSGAGSGAELAGKTGPPRK